MSFQKDKPGSQTMSFSGSLLHLDTSINHFPILAEYKEVLFNSSIQQQGGILI